MFQATKLEDLLKEAKFREETKAAGPYSSIFFHKILSKAFPRKLGRFTPNDVAFAELCTLATLSKCTLATFPTVQEAYTEAHQLASRSLGAHRVVIPSDTPGGHVKTHEFVIREPKVAEATATGGGEDEDDEEEDAAIEQLSSFCFSFWFPLISGSSVIASCAAPCPALR